LSRIKIPFAVKAGASILLLILVLARVDISAVGEALARADALLVLLAVVVGAASWFVNTYKWQLLLGEEGPAGKYLHLLKLNFISLFYNLALPGQVAGEVVKGVRLAQMGIDGRRAAVSVIVDRTTSLLALLALGMMGLALAPPVLGNDVDLLPWLVGITVVLGLVTVALVTGSGLGALGGLPLREGGILHRLSLQMQMLAENSRGWRTLLAGMLLAVLFQLGSVATNYVLCLALGISVSYMQLLWVVAAASLLQSLPISIAGVGVREGAYVYILSTQGVDAAGALALSLLVFGIQVLLALVGGVAHLLGSTQSSKAFE
jgi:uncharacterized membrane protein YbhN (UPF0104 family)